MFLENLKSYFIILLVVGVLGVGAYWAVDSLQVDSKEFDTQKTDIRPIIVNDPTGYSPGQGVTTSTESPTTQKPTTTTTTPAKPTVNQGVFGELKSALQKLVDDNVLMKKGSRGTRVGTIQEFLNIYNGTDAKLDNDFGATTESQVKNFQKAEGLSADGQTGTGTYKKMIEWLDKQN